MKRHLSDTLSAHQVFTVPEAVRHLEASQLQQLQNAFDAWRDAATRPDHLQARERMRLVFLLLRHSGARFGEVRELDERTAFDFKRCVVHIGDAETGRDVPLPETFCSEMETILESPLACQFRGSFFRVDPGYLRRTCYARAEECGLPRELVTPRSLRNSRAVEMLRGGVPLAVVRNALGQSSLDLTAVYQHFSKDDVTSIVRHALEDMRERTSARNSFVGHVVRVAKEAIMAEIILETRSGHSICAVITTESLHTLGIEVGSPVVATVKAPLVNVYRPGYGPSGSCRNRLRGTVEKVLRSEAIAEISGRLPDGTVVCALVSGRTGKEMDVRKGDAVEFRFKGLSVVLNTIAQPAR